MANAKDIFDFPLLYLNYYLHALLSSYDDINMAKNPNIDSYMPFFPAGITSDPVQFYKDLELTSDSKLPAIVYYDRLIRLRNSAFYVGKREQALYTVYAGVEDAHLIGLVVSQVLDREDVSAQDINKWMSDNKEWLSAPKGTKVGNRYGAGLPMKVFFRNMKVFQVDESRDLIELQEFRGGTMHKYIVEYDYHLKDNPDFL
jgi:hypothetical protein